MSLLKVDSAGENVSGGYCYILKDGVDITPAGAKGWKLVILDVDLSLVSAETFDTETTPSRATDLATALDGVTDGWILLGIDKRIGNATSGLLTAMENTGIVFPEKFNIALGNGGMVDGARKSAAIIVHKAGGWSVCSDSYVLDGNSPATEQVPVYMDGSLAYYNAGRMKVKKTSSTKTIYLYDADDVQNVLGTSPLRIQKNTGRVTGELAPPANIGIGNTGLFVADPSGTLGIRDYLVSNKKTNWRWEGYGWTGNYDTDWHYIYFGSNWYRSHDWIWTTPLSRYSQFVVNFRIYAGGPTGWDRQLFLLTQNGWEAGPVVNIAATETYYEFLFDLDYERTIYRAVILPTSWYGSASWTADLSDTYDSKQLYDTYTTR